MNRTVSIHTEAEIEVPGLGVYPAGEHDFEATDEQINTWEAVNTRDWPEGGYYFPALVEETEMPEEVVETPSQLMTFDFDAPQPVEEVPNVDKDEA